MQRASKLAVVMLLALSATGCQWSRSSNQTAYTDPFANPALKVADSSGQVSGVAATKRR
jgi:hypothetical protein